MIEAIILLFIIAVLTLLAVTSTEEDIQKDKEVGMVYKKVQQ